MKKVQVTHAEPKNPADNKPQSAGNRPGEFDPHRKWSNGHKCFNSAESRAHVEQLIHEKNAQDTFYSLKDSGKMRKPRNPLNGDPTPRDVRGTLVQNPRLLPSVTCGEFLFNASNSIEVDPIKFYKKPMTGKIGVDDSRYRILGNTLTVPEDSQMDQSEDLFHLAKQRQLDFVAKKADEEAVNTIIVKEKLRRYELNMIREVERLKQQLESKEKTIQLFSATDTRSLL